MFPRRGAAALLVTTVALVLLISFKTPDDPLPARDGGGVAVVERGTTPSAAPRPSAKPRSTEAPATAASPAPSAASGGGGTAAATTVDGPVVDTQFGPVQVRIDVAAGRIADVVALQLPTGRHSGQISSYAAPVLRQEALQAQSAKIDTVSGATYTSDAYAQSLQAALDKAGLRLMLTHEATSLRRVEPLMGTVVSVEVRPPLVPESVLDDMFEQLRDVEARFSTYRPDSEISRLGRGELREEDSSLDVRHVLTACEHLTQITGGAFSAHRRGTDGSPVLDPSGYVKGWAIEEAAWRLDTAGARGYWINAGGDIVARGHGDGGRPWRVGIRHPDLADRVAAVLEVSDRAVATSGTYERGAHIADPRTGLVPSGLRSVTVVGPGLAFTDAYATALYVMGLDGLRWLAERPDYAALVITDDGRTVWTDGMDRYLVREG